MPTTYTNNNGLSKPGNGELSGSWGTVANTLIDVVDRAMSGVGAITLSGTTTTLTTSDGTLSEGNYRVLVLGGSPSGTNTITIAPNDAQKVYDVFNATSESAVFTQGSGSDVTIPAGGSAVIYADGGGSAGAVADLTSRFIRAGGTYDKLATLNGLAITDGNFIVANGTTWVVKTPVAALVSLGVASTAAELNILDGVTASTAEINILDGVTATTAELNYLAGATSAVQTQLDAKAALAGPTFTGVPAAPTATAGTDTTQVATTAFVAALGALKANAADPAFTGTPSLAGVDLTPTFTELNYMDGVTSNVQTQLDAAPGHAQFELQATQGTNGGTATGGTTHTRGMTNTIENNISGASIGSGNVTLPAGTYDIDAYSVMRETASTRTYLYNNTDSAVELKGVSSDIGINSGSQQATRVHGRITIGSTKVFSIRSYCGASQSANGLGRATDLAGFVEVYAGITIHKVA